MKWNLRDVVFGVDSTWNQIYSRKIKYTNLHQNNTINLQIYASLNQNSSKNNYMKNKIMTIIQNINKQNNIL